MVQQFSEQGLTVWGIRKKTQANVELEKSLPVYQRKNEAISLLPLATWWNRNSLQVMGISLKITSAIYKSLWSIGLEVYHRVGLRTLILAHAPRNCFDAALIIYRRLTAIFQSKEGIVHSVNLMELYQLHQIDLLSARERFLLFRNRIVQCGWSWKTMEVDQIRNGIITSTCQHTSRMKLLKHCTSGSSMCIKQRSQKLKGMKQPHYTSQS
jgi:hypothetical protein